MPGKEFEDAICPTPSGEGFLTGVKGGMDIPSGKKATGGIGSIGPVIEIVNLPGGKSENDNCFADLTDLKS